jgi:uncharacterized protein YpmB
MRGQALSIDLVFAIMILLIIVSTLSVITLQYAQYENEKARNRDLEIKAQYASNTLLYSPGVPINWENTLNG